VRHVNLFSGGDGGVAGFNRLLPGGIVAAGHPVRGALALAAIRLFPGAGESGRFRLAATRLAFGAGKLGFVRLAATRLVFGAGELGFVRLAATRLAFGAGELGFVRLAATRLLSGGNGRGLALVALSELAAVAGGLFTFGAYEGGGLRLGTLGFSGGDLRFALAAVALLAGLLGGFAACELRLAACRLVLVVLGAGEGHLGALVARGLGLIAGGLGLVTGGSQFRSALVTGAGSVRDEGDRCRIAGLTGGILVAAV